jgi:hypothetical protein
MCQTYFTIFSWQGNRRPVTWSPAVNLMPSQWPLIKGFALVAFSLACAALMILAAWWKTGAPAGSLLHNSLEWSIQLLMVLVIVGVSVAGLASRHPSRGGPAQ